MWLVPIHAEGNRHVTRDERVLRSEADDARLDEELLVSPRERRTAAGVPAHTAAVAGRGGVQRTGTAAHAGLEVTLQILIRQVRDATEAIEAEPGRQPEQMRQHREPEPQIA